MGEGGGSVGNDATYAPPVGWISRAGDKKCIHERAASKESVVSVVLVASLVDVCCKEDKNMMSVWIAYFITFPNGRPFAMFVP